MPIYEFRCLQCNDCFEVLVTRTEEKMEMACPKCQSADFERVMSCTNFQMGAGGAEGGGVKTENRTCSSGSCTTWEVGGHAR